MIGVALRWFLEAPRRAVPGFIVVSASSRPTMAVADRSRPELAVSQSVMQTVVLIEPLPGVSQ